MSRAWIDNTAKPESAPLAKIGAPRKHQWRDAGTRPRDLTPSGCEEHERECEHCGLIKLTVHVPQGIPYRAWRSKGGVRFPDPGYTPVCEGVGT